ncbi:hypothetical protein EXN66_Car018007 [Channa argus]|uniref:Osteopontin n=2 Tax=Channa argus TaxID=215402 RepID=A0A6G1QIV4_CHAAH|nr:hypothetical protein EXN66_Car018007 [Channa argus]
MGVCHDSDVLWLSSYNLVNYKIQNCDTMKVAIIFVLLFATVLCLPLKKESSSESSEEVARRPASQAIKKKVAVVPQAHKPHVKNIVAAAAPAAGSDESKESSDEEEKAPEEAPVEVKSASVASVSDTAADTASVKSNSSDEDDDDETEETEEKEEEEAEEEEESSSESGESPTIAPSTVIPVVITEEPVAESTMEPISPTIITDGSRGDSLGGPGDYKSIHYVEEKTYHKIPVPYKSYEFVGTGKKVAYDMTDGNEVEKSLKVYKAIQVHSDHLEEDTSTPEVESQTIDTTSGTPDQDPSLRQASIPAEESSSTGETSTSESSSNPEEEEEEEESASTDSETSSTSQESEVDEEEQEEEESQSSEETTATPGAADSDSDESDSDESDSDKKGEGPDTTTDMPLVITAK